MFTPLRKQWPLQQAPIAGHCFSRRPKSAAAGTFPGRRKSAAAIFDAAIVFPGGAKITGQFFSPRPLFLQHAVCQTQLFLYWDFNFCNAKKLLQCDSNSDRRKKMWQCDSDSDSDSFTCNRLAACFTPVTVTLFCLRVTLLRLMDESYFTPYCRCNRHTVFYAVLHV